MVVRTLKVREISTESQDGSIDIHSYYYILY